MAGKSKRNNEDNIPEGLDDLLNELTGNKNNKEDNIPEGLDDLLNQIKGKKSTATKPKRKRGRPRKKKTSPPGALTTYSKTEDVDSRILELLGLEYTFDLDYDDYANLLKEKLIEVSRGTEETSTEDAMLLREELKKARGNKGKGTFKVKKKISKDSFTNFNVGGPKKDTAQTRKPAYALLKGKEISEKSQRVDDLKEEKKERKQSDNQILKSISKSLDRIIGILSKQLKFDKDQVEKQRKLEERGKRKDKENKRESAFSKGIKSLAKVAGKIFSPLQDFFGKIIRFFTVIFLGKVFQKFLKWFTDPKNESKIKTIGRLLKTFWPTILAGLVFLNPLGRLITKAVFVIGKGVAKLLKVAIPSLLRFGMRNPISATALAAAGLFTFGAWGPKVIPGLVNDEEDDEVKSYKRGGKITTESGQDIKGAGVDTQLIAARPGEVVINKETVNALGADYFLGLNRQHGGSNANKPKTAKVQAASGGGLILPAFSNGGMVGEGPEESRIQKPRKPSKPEDIASGLDSNLIEWAKANPTLARALKVGDIGYREAQSVFDYGSRVAQQVPKVVQPTIDYGSRVAQQVPKVVQPTIDYGSRVAQQVPKVVQPTDYGSRVAQQVPKVVQPTIDYGNNFIGGISKIPSKIEENIPLVQGFADAGAEALPAILSGFLGIKRTDRSISKNMQRAMLDAQKTATEKGRDFIEYEDYAENAGGIAGKYTMGRVADSEFLRDAQGRIIGMSQAYDTNRPADESMAQAWAKSKKFLGIDNSKDVDEFNRLVANRMSSEGASEEEIQKSLMISGGESGQMGDLRTAIYKPFEALLDISQKMHGGRGSTTHEIIFDKDVLGFDPVKVMPKPFYGPGGDPSGSGSGQAQQKMPISVSSAAKEKAQQSQRMSMAKLMNNNSAGLYYSSTTGKTYANYAEALKDPQVAAAAEVEKTKQRFSFSPSSKPSQTITPSKPSQTTTPSKPKRWAMDPRGWFGMEGGGFIKENTGMDIPGGGTDRQRIDVQPGEYVLPVDKVMKMGGPGKLDRMVADLDSNSTPAKMGLRNKDISEGITPYSVQGSGEIDIETLPLSGLGGMGGSSGALNSPNGTQDEFFSPISSAGLSERQRFMDTIGISAFT